MWHAVAGAPVKGLDLFRLLVKLRQAFMLRRLVHQMRRVFCLGPGVPVLDTDIKL